MSFPAYDKYHDSGVPWLGELPQHWDHIPIWLLFDIGRGRVISHEAIMDNLGEYPVFSSQTENDGRMGAIDTFDFEGDYLTWTTDGANAGTVFRRSGRFNCTNVCGTLKPRSEDLILDYAVHAVGISTAFYVRHDINPKLMNDVMAKIRIPVPRPDEQKAIASFLDVETSKIDGLVSEQRRLIELLKEKRQAVISHAVTKGLNPNAPMKPSGIQWLGDVPRHWEVQRVKHAITSIEQGWSPQCENDPVQTESQWGVLKVGCVNYGKFTSEENKALPPTLEPRPELGIQAGDLLISRDNTIELVGSAAVADRDCENLMLCDKLYRIRMDHSDSLPEFLCFFLTCEVAREPIELGATGASPSMKNIAQSVILELWFAAPNVTEQKVIVEAIRERSQAITRLIAEAERAIELLQERRTALISAAVTGKIDVRGFVSEEAVA